MRRYGKRIGAELRLDGEVEVVRSPFDGSPVAEVCVGSARDLEDGIQACVRAFEVTRNLPTRERAAILERAAELLQSRAEELAELMARESGKPIRFCRVEVARAVTTFKLGAGAARTFGGEELPIDLEPGSDGRLCVVTRVPRGPVAAISPFNFPLNLVAHKLSPAIAVGAPVLLKPPPQCPLSALTLAEILLESGLPPGALNVVHCAPQVAQVMVEDPRLKVLSFTGSDAIGWKLKALAGKKQVLLELGGNAPCVVDEGVDIDAVLPAIVGGAWANAGQVCIKIQRLFVHASLFERFLEAFVRATVALPCGDPLDEQTVVGPLIQRVHVERVLSWVREAIADGAKMHCGGDAQGQVVRPTILTNVQPNMRVCKDEVFGPVTVVEPFSDFEAALDACNATRFGLQAGVFTPNLSRALRAFRKLDYGGVMINDIPTFRVDNFPYGGVKDSGFGREGVRYAMEELSEPKVLTLRGLP